MVVSGQREKEDSETVQLAESIGAEAAFVRRALK
jgi:hypothetical protein